MEQLWQDGGNLLTVALRSGDDARLQQGMARKGLTFPTHNDEQGALAARWQVRDVTLEVPLRTLPVVWRGQCGHAADAGVEALGDPFDDAAFACCVAAFKQNDHLLPGACHPVLQLDQLPLQAEQLAEVRLARLLVCLAAVAFTRKMPVVDFQLQLLVVAVDQVALEALHQVVVVVGEAAEVHVRGTQGGNRRQLARCV